MKKILLFLATIISISAPVLAQDTEGTFDHPMFPTRMTNYIRTEYSTNFDAAPFIVIERPKFFSAEIILAPLPHPNKELFQIDYL